MYGDQRDLHVLTHSFPTRSSSDIVGDRAQRVTEQSLKFLSASALLAARRLAIGARAGRAGKHAVLGGDPAAARVAKPRRNGFLDGRGAEHMGVAEAREAGTFGVLVHVGFQHDVAKLVRSEEHTSELQSLMRISYAVFCLKKK